MKQFIEASCGSKKRYSSIEYAGQLAAKLKAERGVNLRIYPCMFCGGFHLTSSEDTTNIIVPQDIPQNQTPFKSGKKPTKSGKKPTRCISGHITTLEFSRKKCSTCLELETTKKSKIAEAAAKLNEKYENERAESHRAWAEKYENKHVESHRAWAENYGKTNPDEA